MPEWVLGVDSGGSKTIAALADAQGHILGQGAAGPSNYQVVGQRAAEQAVLAACHLAYEAAGLPFEMAGAICLGMAGVDRPEDQRWAQNFARQARLGAQVVVVNDGYLLLWAGTPNGWGIGIISGTGSICLGRSADDRTARAGGWGYLIGDEGSGYALGVAALRAISQAADGRAPATALTGAVMDFWELPDPTALIGKVYRGSVDRAELARLAQPVLECAAEGDAAARSIIRQAGCDLAQMAASVVRQLELTSPIPCALGGGVLTRSSLLADSLLECAAAGGVQLAPVQHVEQPVRGAIRLAQRALTA